MNRVGIVDYGMCNLDSVARAVEECGGRPVVSAAEAELSQVDRIILPGVGAFPEAMRNLKERGLDAILAEQVHGKAIPMLGICLGMQLFATRAMEFGETPGLGWIEGEVHRLEPFGEDTRIPHVGWNEVHAEKPSALLAAPPGDPHSDFYFVHSYHFRPAHGEDVLARTPYGEGFVSAVQHGHVYGVQFHPEKSQRAGFRVLRNFLSL